MDGSSFGAISILPPAGVFNSGAAVATFEQAIFASACTAHGQGYHLASRSSGISPEMARELSRWGPSHDCFVNCTDEPRSVNFFRLACGSLCTSLTMAAGVEQSGRAGENMLTHYLVAQDDALLEFSNDPFAVVRAADALGVFERQDMGNDSLDQIRLGGSGGAVDIDSIDQAVAQFSAYGMAHLLSSCLNESFIATTGHTDAELVVRALLHLVPLDRRTELSFSTALKHSPRRPFRLLGSAGDRAAQHQLERTHQVRVVDLGQIAENAVTEDDTHKFSCPWATFVFECLEQRDYKQLIEAVDYQSGADTMRDLEHSGPSVTFAEQDEASAVVTLHRATSGSVAGVEHGQWVERLGKLDDTVFDAIAGDAGALESLKTIWPVFCGDLDRDAVEESREQYLRYVVDRWQRGASSESDAASADALLDIVSLLVDAP